MANTVLNDANRVQVGYALEGMCLTLPPFRFITVKPRWSADVYRWPHNEFEQDMNKTIYGDFNESRGYDPRNYVGADVVDEVLRGE